MNLDKAPQVGEQIAASSSTTKSVLGLVVRERDQEKKVCWSSPFPTASM